MRRIIRELRRREVFGTLGLYVGVCWILLQVASTLFPAFDSPEWVLRALVVVAIAGFPIVAVLAWVYDATGSGIARDSDVVDAPVAPLGGRKMDFVVIGVLIGALSFSIYLNVRAPPEQPQAVDPITVLVADFENRTGDPIFDGLVEHALTLGIQNAPHVAILDRNEAQGLAEEVGASRDRLDVDTARLIAIREALGMVLSGSIEPEGEGYRLRLSGLAPTSGDVDFELSEEATSRDAVLAAVASLSTAAREALGDPTLRIADPVTGSRTGVRSGISTTSIEAAKASTIGRELQFEGRHAEAIEYFRTATELDPDYSGAYSAWAISEYELGRRESAERLFEKMLTLLDKMSDHDRLSRLGVYYYTTQNYQKALESYSELAAQYPADGAALNNYAVMAFMTLDFDRALQIGEQVLEIFPNGRLYRSNYALYAMYAGDFELAAEIAQKVIDEYPDHGVAYLPLAIERLVAHDLDGARDVYLRMAMVSAGRIGASTATLGLADIDIYTGDFDRAEELLGPGIEADMAERREYNAALKYVAVAEARLEAADLPAATAAAREALELSPSVSIQVPAALVLTATGDADSLDMIADQLAGALQPHNRAYGMMLSAVSLRSDEDYVAAIELLQSALNLADLWRIRFELGRVYLEAGYFAEAYDEFQRCADRRGEATALFLEDMPTFHYLTHLLYWMARAEEGLNVPDAAEDNYLAFLELRPSGGLFVDDARRRLAALRSDN